MNYNALPRGRDLRSLYVRWDPGHSPKVVLGLPVLPITLLSPGSILFSGEKRSLKDTQQEEASPLPMRGWHSIQGVSFSPTPPPPPVSLSHQALPSALPCRGSLALPLRTPRGLRALSQYNEH
jgi:hypothetical protein